MENIQIKNEHYYRQLYGQWKGSNLGVKAFCEQQSVKYATFRYWIRKYEQPRKVVAGFTEFKMGGPPIGSNPVAVLSLGTKASLSFYELPDPTWIKSLLS